MGNSQRQLIELCKRQPQRSFKRQRMILYQGEVPRSVYIIQTGVVRGYNIVESGEERMVELLSVGDILPVSWLYGTANAALYYYDAFSDAKLYVCPRDEFLSLIREQALEGSLLELMAKRYTANTMHTNALLQTHAQQKIVQGLQYLVLSHGVRQSNGKSRINIRLTQQDLANLVGITRETAAVELNKLRDKKIISYRSFTYTVDYQALIRVGGGDEFGDVSL